MPIESLLFVIIFLVYVFIQWLARSWKQAAEGEPQRPTQEPEPASEWDERPSWERPSPAPPPVAEAPPPPYVPPPRIVPPPRVAAPPARRAPAAQRERRPQAPPERRAPLAVVPADPAELRRAIVLMTVLGPPRALDPPGR